jgi:hypothetical protein
MAITNGYATLAQVKTSLRIVDDIDNSALELAIEASSRAIDTYTMRSFYSSGTATRYYAPDSELLVNTDDMAGTAITIQTSSNADSSFNITWQTTDYQLEPLNGISDGITIPYSRIRAVGTQLFPIFWSGGEATVKITAVWGWPSIPIAVTQACIIQASRFFKRNDSPLGVAGFGDMGIMRISRNLDPDVEQLVHPYKQYRNVG